jgi:ceramide glucosyltransferase
VTLAVILAVLATLSLGLTLWQVVVAWRFPLHRRITETRFMPAVTILKPLKGCDSETAECLRSWFSQHYAGPVQILFGVASSDDPVCSIVRRLIEEHPSVPAQLVICDEKLGTNAKVAKLAQLERLARHEVLCVSDADVWVPSDYLANAVAPLRRIGVGLVNSLYRFARPAGFAMRWEAFAVNADFWSQVLQSLSLQPMDFGLGAAMVMPRRQLERIGGFAALADHLADDYQLGQLVSQGGGCVELCPVVVECRTAPMTFLEVCSHQLRWARTIRVCRPVAFVFTVFSIAAIWPVLWLVAQPSVTSVVGAITCLAIRGVAGIYLECRMTGLFQWSSAAWALVKDALQLGIWALATTGRRVVWRGVDYRVEPGGRLVKRHEVAPPPLRPA